MDISGVSNFIAILRNAANSFPCEVQFYTAGHSFSAVSYVPALDSSMIQTTLEGLTVSDFFVVVVDIQMLTQNQMHAQY
jgi:hypothetical protein